MANIRVDVNYTIKDGSEIVFRSPVDCTAITGLIVYYLGEDGNTTSKEFAFADAHGNNVGDIPHLFAENVVVKVILDVTSGMAFVQNADTNAYLESRFAEILAYVDENAGGVSSWNDLTDKPFGEEGEEVTIFPEQTLPIPFIGDGVGMLQHSPAMFVLVEGETYRVVHDGAEYEIKCVSNEGALILAHIVKDESGTETHGTFGIQYQPPEYTGTDGGAVAVFVLDSTNTANHTFAIYQGGIKKLDAKFLPMAAIDARIDAYIEEALGGDY